MFLYYFGLFLPNWYSLDLDPDLHGSWTFAWIRIRNKSFRIHNTDFRDPGSGSAWNLCGSETLLKISPTYWYCMYSTIHATVHPPALYLFTTPPTLYIVYNVLYTMEKLKWSGPEMRVLNCSWGQKKWKNWVHRIKDDRMEKPLKGRRFLHNLL